jgi:hypothetical protein
MLFYRKSTSLDLSARTVFLLIIFTCVPLLARREFTLFDIDLLLYLGFATNLIKSTPLLYAFFLAQRLRELFVMILEIIIVA